MAEFVIHVGSSSAQGKRSNNEDRFVADNQRHVFLVADGMGGQESGERASGLAAEIIPRVVRDRLDAHVDASAAVQQALEEAHQAGPAPQRQQRGGEELAPLRLLHPEGVE